MTLEFIFSTEAQRLLLHHHQQCVQKEAPANIKALKRFFSYKGMILEDKSYNSIFA